jgi:hypothetical protein
VDPADGSDIVSLRQKSTEATGPQITRSHPVTAIIACARKPVAAEGASGAIVYCAAPAARRKSAASRIASGSANSG